jgi:hypothetical protein
MMQPWQVIGLPNSWQDRFDRGSGGPEDRLVFGGQHAAVNPVVLI